MRPALAGDTLEWIANPDARGTSELWRARVTTETPPQKVAGLENLNLFAPAPLRIGERAFTILAVTKPETSVPRIRVVPRD